MSRLCAAMRALAFGASALLCAGVAAEERELGPRVLHVPVSQRFVEQGILTPVPIALDVPAGLRARRVLAHYKMWGAPEWATLELRRKGEHWEGAIPCLEVSTITGDILYYVRVHDGSGAVVAYSGTRREPYRVRIRNQGDEAGAKARCPDPADCPLGLPGCPSAPVEKIPCRSDRDCEGGETCSWEGFCELTTRRYHWVSLEAEQDVGFVATAGACSFESQRTEGYACYRDDGVQYVGNPELTNEPLRAGLGPTRVLFGYEQLVSYNALLGVRLGYAFRGSGRSSPGAADFVPFSGELGLRWFFGTDPFGRSTLRPFVVSSAGFAQYDLHLPVDVREDVRSLGGQGGNDLEQTLDVWKRAGDAYVGVGGGVRIPVATATDLGAELDVLQVFPFGATVILLRVGVAQGF